MNRLRHSWKGYRRKMQMSSYQIFVFVEGKINDPYFYGEICRAVVSQSSGIRYTIRQAKEIPGDTGGKSALIAFFLYLKRNSALLDNFKDKKTGIIFFLDKDVDDLLRKQRRSEHVVYTQHYDVENHIFVEGNLGKAAAAAASMDYQQIIAGIGDYNNWRDQAAKKWKEWVKLCLFARKKDIGCECTYRNPSKINNPLYELLDSTTYAQYLNRLENRSGLSSVQFKMAFKRVSKLVDNLYAAGEHDRIFKGKWYAGFLEAKIKTIAGNTPFNSKTLANRLTTAITMTLDFDAPWAEQFKEPLKKLIKKL
ncbi:DUF4435 domain-containing protein [Candidatus Marithioploca araucensis]|uniref:DUF4435 domain-containing protein n=1 Tax=Candidatus Marithioploca araucensis TaxID=70273 RepID=A0ABT7VQ47_9GAMM|nr:DUF4435 domain-containing protein [Candidatus Marithioploca araucensis]